MQHLSSDDLARLVDEPMTAQELAHASRCRQCMTAIEEMRLQTMALGALPPLAPPARAWGAIERRVSASPSIRVRRAWWPERRHRFAAAAMWMLIGAGIQAALVALMFASSTRATPSPLPFANETARPAGMAQSPTSDQQTEQALEKELRSAEEKYYAAYLDYAASHNMSGSQSMATRLATLDAMLATTGAALERAPADPLINGYHLSVLAERDALLKQLSIRESGPGGEREW